MTDSVYIFASGPRIKVGFSTCVETRLTSWRNNLPHGLEMIATLPGGRALERAIHRRLRTFAVGREWFLDTPRSREIIAGVISSPPKVEEGEIIPPHPVQEAINEELKAAFPRVTWRSVQNIIGCTERTVKHRIAGTRAYDIDDLAALISSEIGDKVVAAIIRAKKVVPEWYEERERNHLIVAEAKNRRSKEALARRRVVEGLRKASVRQTAADVAKLSEEA